MSGSRRESKFIPPPNPPIYIGELLNHSKSFKEPKCLLVHYDLQLFRTYQVRQIIDAHEEVIEIVKPISCNPTEKLWDLIEANVSVDQVHNVKILRRPKKMYNKITKE